MGLSEKNKFSEIGLEEKPSVGDDSMMGAGYKDSPLGRIPVDWEVKKLGRIAQVTSGGTPDRKNLKFWNGTIPWITTSLLDFNIINAAEEYITEEGLKNSAAKVFEPGSILLALYGQGITRGKTAILGIPAATNQACAAIIVSSELIHKPYLFQFLIFKYLDIRKLSNTGNQENLNGEIVKSIQIILPPFNEQRAMALVLAKIDDLISKTNQLIAQKELRKKWLMLQLLTGKRRLKGFEGEWKEHSFGKLLKVVKRPVVWDDEELYKLVSVRRRSGGLFFRERLYGNQILVKDLRSALSGDFLFSKMQIVHGASSLVTEEFHGAKISGSYISVVARNPQILNMEFFNYCSQLKYFYHQTYISSYGVHIEKMTFDFESFLTLGIQIPPIEEQVDISKVILATDLELRLLKSKLEKLKEQKRGMMQVLFTGKKRLVGLKSNKNE